MKNYFILKEHCRNIFLIGSGNFWYEEGYLGNDASISYRLYTFVIISIYILMTILEIMAAVFGDLPKDEKSDSVTLALSHTIVMLKIASVLLNKGLIKELNKKMVDIGERHEKPELMAEKYKLIKLHNVFYFVLVYGAVGIYIFDCVAKALSGSHFIFVVTYYPSNDDDSYLAASFRVFTTLVLMMMLMTMITTVDAYTVIYLIMYKYKFISLRHYFEDLRKEFDRINGSGRSHEAAITLKNALVEGIVMHSELLSMSTDIDKAFGLVMALQLFQSSGAAVSLLLQIALSKDMSLVASIKIICFVLALFLPLSLFLCNAGEITYEASLIPDAIFYCGWHACASEDGVRNVVGRLVLQACARAQQPLVMKAFKMVELNYVTLLAVVRGTYSVFALFYAQNK